MLYINKYFEATFLINKPVSKPKILVNYCSLSPCFTNGSSSNTLVKILVEL